LDIIKEETNNIEVFVKKNMSGRIKDIDISLNTVDENEAVIETKSINGFLDSLIISTNKKTGIDISFLGHSDIKVFSVQEFEGIQLLPIRIQGFDPNGELSLPSSNMISLNNPLKIIIRGTKDTIVDITMRII